MKKILLMGNPNVGKSVLFSRLTGVRVVSSNYPGTTVDYTAGHLNFEGETIDIIDVPGTYSLEPTSPVEEVAAKMIEEGDCIINVIDATNLERNLNLTLSLEETGLPMIVALNMWDETTHKGVAIDTEKLEEMLGVPVIPTCALTGEGTKHLVYHLSDIKQRPSKSRTKEERWDEIGHIISESQKFIRPNNGIKEIIQEASLKPLTGLPIALTIMSLTFMIIRYLGESLVGLMEFVFQTFWHPLLIKLSSALGGQGLLHDIIVGKINISEEGMQVIDFQQSFGMLSTGLFVPVAMVFPYVLSFYLILCVLEDTGYLPRFAVLIDNIMHRLGLHGHAGIAMILGLGCNVPGALAMRNLETKRERFIAAVLLSTAVPCISQTAMVIGLLGNFGIKPILYVFISLIAVWCVLGFILNKVLKGESTPLFLEIPPYRVPSLVSVLMKLYVRVKSFLMEAVPFVMLGVMIVSVLYATGIVDFLGKLFEPLVKYVWGLPPEAVTALVVGFLRKDVAVGMLVPLSLTVPQLVIASVILVMYFPCVATFSVLIKELGLKGMLKASLIMMVSTLITGGLLNFIFSFIY